jgi:hypothetical protein
MYKKKTELDFIHSFIPPKDEGSAANTATRTSKQKHKEKHLQLFFCFMVLEEMNKI